MRFHKEMTESLNNDLLHFGASARGQGAKGTQEG